MWTDVVDLRDFYATALGQVARRMIRRRIRAQWPDVKGQGVLGLGYATPYLRSFLDEGERVIAAMPATQGVLHWPPDANSRTTLVDELELPFDDLSFDKVLLVHGLECAEHLRPMLREVWRVMDGSGRLMVVVPNRRGLWARFERTPFGHGQPYTIAQLSRLLRDNMFTPVEQQKALYVPPSRSRMLLSSAPAWERVGNRFFSAFAGVIIMEAVKQIYAAQPAAQRETRRGVLPIPHRTPGASSRHGRISGGWLPNPGNTE